MATNPASPVNPNEEASKEQLTFVSGYVLVFGFALLKLWPIAARFQTGMTVHFWTVNLPQEGVRTPLIVFWALTALLGLALSAVFLAILHILCRGIWLGMSLTSSSVPPTHPAAR